MLEIAAAKGTDNPRAQWKLADMRSFALGRRFELVIVPGHSFQFMLRIPDQLECLQTLRQHLAPGGRLVLHVDHQDLHWLGSLPAESAGAMDAPSEVRLPNGRTFRVAKRWSYDRATQTASVVARYQELGELGVVIDSVERGPIRLHCFFRYELELLCQRAGFAVEALYGDFRRSELGAHSTEMVWVLRVPVRN
jgi:hypothetical protein